jgi:hypothetical protein
MSAVISNTTRGIGSGPFYAAIVAAALAAPGGLFRVDLQNMQYGYESAPMPKGILLSHLLVFAVLYLALSGNIFGLY